MYVHVGFGTEEGTPLGRAVVIKLYLKETPDACRAFADACRTGYGGGVRRVVPGFLLQCRRGGDARPELGASMNDRYFHAHSRAGLVGLTKKLDFYVTYNALPHLNGESLVIGEVVAGMATVRDLEGRPTGNKDAPESPVCILSSGVCDTMQAALAVYLGVAEGGVEGVTAAAVEAVQEAEEPPADRRPLLSPDDARAAALRQKDAGNARFKGQEFAAAAARYQQAVRYLQYAERWERQRAAAADNAQNADDEGRETLAAVDEAAATALAVSGLTADGLPAGGGGVAAALPPAVAELRRLRGAVYLNLAAVQLQTGSAAEARHHAREATKLDPGNPKAYYRYASAVMAARPAAAGEHDELAWALAKEALRLAPADPAVKALHHKAAVAWQQRKGKLRAAMSAWTNALAPTPRTVEFVDGQKKKRICITRCPDAPTGITYTFNGQARGRIMLVDARAPPLLAFPGLKKTVAVPDGAPFPPKGLAELCAEAGVELLEG
eukprot:TRINITY_DN3433_c0_g1_i1.p1 TRINITY_DN3433_c0_g1~~TRINITY_DN3433_c0_g1_i1.p1  ORF type:complete len:496 (+),score=183.62 TRINITY_DN3433_c0_g1_i1:155-1642(+)